MADSLYREHVDGNVQIAIIAPSEFYLYPIHGPNVLSETIQSIIRINDIFYLFMVCLCSHTSGLFCANHFSVMIVEGFGMAILSNSSAGH